MLVTAKEFDGEDVRCRAIRLQFAGESDNGVFPMMGKGPVSPSKDILCCLTCSLQWFTFDIFLGRDSTIRQSVNWARPATSSMQASVPATDNQHHNVPEPCSIVYKFVSAVVVGVASAGFGPNCREKVKSSPSIQ